jgi:hypothetical protein
MGFDIIGLRLLRLIFCTLVVIGLGVAATAVRSTSSNISKYGIDHEYIPCLPNDTRTIPQDNLYRKTHSSNSTCISRSRHQTH